MLPLTMQTAGGISAVPVSSYTTSTPCASYTRKTVEPVHVAPTEPNSAGHMDTVNVWPALAVRPHLAELEFVSTLVPAVIANGGHALVVVGAAVGSALGRGLGAVGRAVGGGVGVSLFIVGLAVGNALGCGVGRMVVGNIVGTDDGVKDGLGVELTEGIGVGSELGAIVGASVGANVVANALPPATTVWPSHDKPTLHPCFNANICVEADPAGIV